jgi:hypothetical protein
MNISLAKALKLKNKIGANIKKIGQRIQQSNSYLVGNKISYSVRPLLEEYASEVNKLTNLKTKISQANQPINEKIIKMAEIKAEITMLNGMNTTEGTHTARYGQEAATYAVQIAQVEKDKMIASLEEEIEKLQDELDTYNATTLIEF